MSSLMMPSTPSSPLFPIASPASLRFPPSQAPGQRLPLEEGWRPTLRLVQKIPCQLTSKLLVRRFKGLLGCLQLLGVLFLRLRLFAAGPQELFELREPLNQAEELRWLPAGASGGLGRVSPSAVLHEILNGKEVGF